MPYKRAKTLSESLGIMRDMARTGHVDPDFFALFAGTLWDLAPDARDLPVQRARLLHRVFGFDVLTAKGRQAKAGITRLAMRSIWPGSSVTGPRTRYASPAATRSAIRALIRAGQPVRRLRSAADVTTTGRRSARLEGFSLHADVAVPARARSSLIDKARRRCDAAKRPAEPAPLLGGTAETGRHVAYPLGDGRASR